MNHRRKKNLNAINVPSLARWIVITAFLGATGLSYVYLTLQLHNLGDRRKALSADPKRSCAGAGRRADLALSSPAPAERGLHQNDSDQRTKHCAFEHPGALD